MLCSKLEVIKESCLFVSINLRCGLVARICRSQFESLLTLQVPARPGFNSRRRNSLLAPLKGRQVRFVPACGVWGGLGGGFFFNGWLVHGDCVGGGLPKRRRDWGAGGNADDDCRVRERINGVWVCGSLRLTQAVGCLPSSPDSNGRPFLLLGTYNGSGKDKMHAVANSRPQVRDLHMVSFPRILVCGFF